MESYWRSNRGSDGTASIDAGGIAVMSSLRSLRKRQGCGHRFTNIKVILSLCMTIYSIFIATNYLRISSNSDFPSVDNGVLSKSCWLSDSSMKIQNDSALRRPDARQGDRSSKDIDLFRILCTSTRKKIKLGSYQLRCRDLKTWAQKCTRGVHIVTGISFEDIQRMRWLRSIFGQLAEEEKIQYNSTIFVKSFPERTRLLPSYGNMFVDMVDEYDYFDDDIPPEMHLILQTELQGRRVFPTHKYTVVEHWYNSFPADMDLSGSPDYVPPVSDQSDISIATVWNTKRGKVPFRCPEIRSSNVSYTCLDQPFDISTWYLKLFREGKDRCEMEKILANPRLGSGMLYFNVFRRFDALVVLAKNDSMKLEYGNVQRAVSQMRSGVPVLIEIQGSVLEDFATRYNYTCTFQRTRVNPTSKRLDHRKAKYNSIDEAIAQLTRPDIRKQCQEEGLAIVNDYSPSKIAQKYLRAVGYPGDFLC